jgi:hypothetical protein
MKSSIILAVVQFVGVLSLAACGDNGRLKAVQAAMDASARQPILSVPNNDYCGQLYAKTVGRRDLDPDSYKGMSHVSVTPVVTHDFMGAHNCFHFAWDSSARFDAFGTAEDRSNLIIGRYVVDKVGDDQTGLFGAKIAPFKAHFEANDIGKMLIARGLARAPNDIENGQATVGTDADGKWVVSNVAW